VTGFRGLIDQVVVVTGAAGGIGSAICRRLSEEGAALALLDRDAGGLERLASELQGARVSAHAVDITQGDAVESAVAASESELGDITGLVNNAGWDRAARFTETDAELWRQVIDINLYGPLHTTLAVLRRMEARGVGRIVSIASDAGRVGSSGESVYAACKGGIIAFSKSVAREVAKSGITLNIIAPGPTDTALLAGVDPTGKLQQGLARAIPMRRLGQPDDIPGLVAFLLSDDASFITGQTISVSGGLTMS
jgi:2-hydroxycyclohexanecarboxyl-CoA dehydrogenase